MLNQNTEYDSGHNLIESTRARRGIPWKQEHSIPKHPTTSIRCSLSSDQVMSGFPHDDDMYIRDLKKPPVATAQPKKQTQTFVPVNAVSQTGCCNCCFAVQPVSAENAPRTRQNCRVQQHSEVRFLKMFLLQEKPMSFSPHAFNTQIGGHTHLWIYFTTAWETALRFAEWKCALNPQNPCTKHPK